MTEHVQQTKEAHWLALPNVLTYGRIVAVPLVALCFFLEGKLQSSDLARWSALGIFIVASITDFFDGYLARAWHMQSAIGRMFDPIADKLLVATTIVILVGDWTIGGWSLSDINVGQLHLHSITAMLKLLLSACLVNQNSLHGDGRRPEKVTTILPCRRSTISHIIGAHQPQKRFVNQCRRLQRMAGLFVLHPTGRHASQFVIDQRQ